MSSKENLESQLRELRAAKAEFEHQLRRFGDAAERMGGVLGASEVDVKQIHSNLKLTDKEISRIEAELSSYP